MEDHRLYKIQQYGSAIKQRNIKQILYNIYTSATLSKDDKFIKEKYRKYEANISLS